MLFVMQLKKVTTLFHPRVRREEKFTMSYQGKNDRVAVYPKYLYLTQVVRESALEACEEVVRDISDDALRTSPA